MSRRPDDAGRRGQLIRESARLFREKGYEATSVRDIAAATGLQSGSWVYHFKTKQDILAAVMEEGLQRALERIEAIGREQLPPREHFRALLRAHLDTILAPGPGFHPGAALRVALARGEVAPASGRPAEALRGRLGEGHRAAPALGRLGRSRRAWTGC